jgi:hypothetical protein
MKVAACPRRRRHDGAAALFFAAAVYRAVTRAVADEIPAHPAAYQRTVVLAVSGSTTTVADAEKGGFRILRKYFCGDHALVAKMNHTVHPYSVSSLRVKKKIRLQGTISFTLFDASSSVAR